MGVTQDDVAKTATISWAAPPPVHSPITGYRVSRDGNDSGTTGPFSTIVPATATSKTFTHLNSWDTYNLKVEAINAVGTGPAGTGQVTLTAPTPSGPQSVIAKAGSTGTSQATVSWSAPLQAGSSPITGYRIRRFLGAGTTAQTTTTVSAATRTLTATGLTIGAGYAFDVVAINTAGAGRISPRTATVTPLALPGAPTGLVTSASAAAKSATVSWTAPAATGGSPITGYRVSRDGTDSNNTGAFSTVLPATARTKTFTFLNPWDTYALKVEAITAAGTGPGASKSVTVPGSAPSTPLTVVAKAGNKTATLTWVAPAQTGTSAITGYVIRRYLGAGTAAQATTTVAATARTLTVTSLVNGTGYTFTVTATNASGAGRTSARTAVVTPKV